jgi:hypothetical protein
MTKEDPQEDLEKERLHSVPWNCELGTTATPLSGYHPKEWSHPEATLVHFDFLLPSPWTFAFLELFYRTPLNLPASALLHNLLHLNIKIFLTLNKQTNKKNQSLWGRA